MLTKLTKPAVALAVVALFLTGARETVRFVKPIAVGVWYPAEKEALKTAVNKYIDESTVSVPPGRVVACVLPHAPYQTSGPLIGAACKALQPGTYDRVILLAASHYSSFRGCSIPAAQGYVTPLGEVLLDCPSIRTLDLSTLIEVRSLQYETNALRKQMHEREYTTEVLLPFLQERLGKFILIPILVGDFKEYSKKADENALQAVADAIRPFLDDRTLLVVSTDLTHFGNKFSYRPFRGDDVLKGIRMLDETALDLLVKRDYPLFQQYLEETQNTICGKTALSLMLRLLPTDAKGHVTAHEISAEKTGDTSTSVSYASILYTVPADSGETTANARP